MTEAGDPVGPAIVLLHGAGLGAWMWQPQLAPLAARYHVLAPDLPGCGAVVDGGPFTLARGAAAVAALIRARGGGVAHVCGLSVGAMVALQLAQDAPETLASLTLSAGQVHANPLLMGAQRIIMSCIPERAFTESLPAAFERNYPDLVEGARASAKRTGKRGVLALIHAAARADFRLWPATGFSLKQTVALTNTPASSGAMCSVSRESVVQYSSIFHPPDSR